MTSQYGLNTDRLDAAFLSALEQGWCADTCWPAVREDYTDENPAYGQCLVSTLAAWASRDFRDTVMPGLALYLNQPTWHFRLMELGTPVDLTWQQFPEGTYFQPLPIGLPMRSRVVEGSIYDRAENADLRQRLALLLERMDRVGGYHLAYSANEIIDHAEQHFDVGRRSQPEIWKP